ncbi:hypothetical protein D3C87_1503380 [compost metagenome]
MESQRMVDASSKVMGYSLRTKRYRYTIWMENFRSNMPFKASSVVGDELYDYEKDPEEKVNVAADKKYEQVTKDLKNKMIRYFRSKESR